jgi:hypothetical protein
MATSDNPFVIDPTKLGPLDRCLVCFTPKGDAVAYCEKCGRTGSFFAVEEPQRGTVCSYHPNVPAKTCCVLCGKAACASCIEREGISLARGLSTPQCRECLRRTEELEKSFRERLEHDKTCAKHSNEPAALRCVECRLPHCEQCLYFTIIGWRRRRLDLGPLCLLCFRLKTHGHGRGSWVSLPEAKAGNLLRGIDPAALL